MAEQILKKGRWRGWGTGRFQTFRHRPNLWIFLALLIANGMAWIQVSSRSDFPEYAPLLHPELAEIREKWQSGEAVGETFAVTVTDQMAMETMTWFLEPRPEAPVSHPYIEIHPDGVTGGGVLHLLGLRTPVLGTAAVWVENGRVEGEVQSVSVAGAEAPAFVLGVVEQGKAIYDNLAFPIEITTLELREGEVYIEGVYR